MKHHTLLGLFLILSVNLSAQDLPIFDIGPKVGLVISQFRNVEDNLYEDSRLGFSAGAWARVKITPSGFFLQPELLFSYAGGKENELNFTTFDFQGSFVTEISTESSLSLSSLEIPVLFGKRFAIKAFGLNVYAGPSLGIILDAKASFDGIPRNVLDLFIDVESFENTNTLQYSIMVGTELHYKRFSLDARYQYGLSNVFDFPGDGGLSDTKMNALICSLGYRLL